MATITRLFTKNAAVSILCNLAAPFYMLDVAVFAESGFV